MSQCDANFASSHQSSSCWVTPQFVCKAASSHVSLEVEAHVSTSYEAIVLRFFLAPQENLPAEPLNKHLFELVPELVSVCESSWQAVRKQATIVDRGHFMIFNFVLVC